jgi:dethiobiotin synthetase
MKKIIVTGIGTDIGKTLVSAVLVEGLSAEYWKPVQSGTIQGSDSEIIRRLAPKVKNIHPETYLLKAPLSPHAAAELDSVTIELDAIKPPEHKHTLIIEGAGGLLVPLNNHQLMIDLFKKLNAPVVLVSRHYLGSINHTLLSIEALRAREIPILGIIFNGDRNLASQKAILAFSGLRVLAYIPEFTLVDQFSIQEIVNRNREVINELK